MKKLGLIIALFLLFSAVSDGAVPNDIEFRKGLQLYNNKNYKAAVKQLQGYVSKKPDPAAYYLLGYSLYKLGRFSEADEYFSQAFLIDPEFSLEKAGVIEKPSREIVPPKPSATKGPAAVPEANPTKAGDETAKSPEKKPQPSKPAPALAVQQSEKGPGTAAPATAPKAAPAAKQQPPTPTPMPAPSVPGMRPPSLPKSMPGAADAPLAGIIAALGVFFFVILIGLYIFAGLCLFLIAKKLNVPAPWTAWIPLVNLWTLVACAGKPVWWLLLCFIPIVNAFVFIYLYMCVTENLGKNKWLGLLMLIPVVNLAFLGWLAFSRSESPEVQ